MSAGHLNAAVDAIMAAEGALCRARKEHPDRGSCAIRAVIDVELDGLKRSRQHLMAARGALDAPTSTAAKAS